MTLQIIPELCHHGRFDSTIESMKERIKLQPRWPIDGILSARSFTKDRFQWSADCTSGSSILNLTTILGADLPNCKRRSPSGIGGQFRRVSSVEHNFVESLTSLELVPREKFSLLRNEDGRRAEISRFILLGRSVYS